MTRRIVVLEKRPRWAPELQRQLGDEGVRVTACRSAADAEVECRTGSVSVLVVDLAVSPGSTLELLGRRTGRPRPAIVAIASGRTAELEWPARELGAAAFLSESVTGDELARLCRRFP